MTFQEAEKTYKDLKAQHAAGKLSDADFEAQVGKLKMQDAQGKWWQIGVQTGEWYVHDGQKWSKAKPPAETQPLPPPSEPGASPEAAAATAPLAPNNKAQRASVAPTRLFSAKPAGREGGLPTSVLIIIVAVVAIVGIAILVGGYLLFSGSFTAKGTSTPTRIAQATPAVVVPTITLARPTDLPTALPSPTVGVTATVPTTTTAATPTRRPVTPATKPTVAPTKPGPVASATPVPPPGLYVIKMVSDPVVTNPNELIGFKITLFNNSGKFDQLSTRVKIYSCPDQGPCSIDDLRKSLGETKATTIDLVGGTFEITAPRTWQTGVGACKFVAVPFYTEKDSGQLLAFQTTVGKNLYYEFSLCR